MESYWSRTKLKKHELFLMSRFTDVKSRGKCVCRLGTSYRGWCWTGHSYAGLDMAGMGLETSVPPKEVSILNGQYKEPSRGSEKKLDNMIMLVCNMKKFSGYNSCTK